MPILKPNEIFANRYRLIRNIGAGGYSEVWLAADQMAGDLEIALKVYAPGQGLDDQAIQIFRGEYKGVFYLNHPNLLKPTHFDIFDGRPYLILPFCAKGSIMKMTGQIEEISIAKMLKQIGGALDYLHMQNPPIIHRDIKPENILVDDADYYYLCDFGISSKLRRTLTKSMGRGQESSGTVAFMAPELFQAKRQILPESDIFSFGVMIYELITDELPFGQIGGAMLMNGAQVPDMSEFCSLGLAQIVSKCLNLDPQQRPTGAELKKYGDTYLKTGNWILNEKVGRKTEIQPVFNVKNKNGGANDFLNIPFGNAKIKMVKDYMRTNLVSLLSIILRLFNKNSDLDQQNLNKIGKYSSYLIFAIISYVLFNYCVFENMTFLKGLFAIGFGLGFCKILMYNYRNFKYGLINNSNQLDKFHSKSMTITSWSLIGIGILYSMSVSDFKTYYYDYWIVLLLFISMIGGSFLLINFVKNISNSHNKDILLINNSKIYLNLFFMFLGFGFVRIADWSLGIIIGDSVISFSIFAPFWQGAVSMPNIVLLMLLSALSSLLYSLYFKVFFNAKKIFILFFILFGLSELFFQVLNLNYS